MAGCCDSSGYPRVFGEKTARRSVKGFLSDGLDSTAGPMVEALGTVGIDDASVLEVGAGSATAIVALLEAGAGSATAVDISPAYKEAASALMTERGHADAFTWVTGDFVAAASDLEASDVVFLNRVVCCYPDMDRMVDAAGSKANRFLAMAYPRRRWLVKAFMGVTNLLMRVRRNSFRVFVHDPDAIADRVGKAGFTPVTAGTTPAWHWAVWRREAVGG